MEEDGSPPGDLPIEPYKANYFLFLTYDRKVEEQDDRLPQEFKFQLSLKKNLIEWRYLPTYFGYTQKSFWQIYDQAHSAPFRESNYNPELFVDYDLTLLRESPFGFRVGIEHESNGRTGEFSRSWNRFYLKPSYHQGLLWLSLKAWHRFEEQQKIDENDQGGDDNPDIDHYLGNWEFQAYLPVAKYFDLSLLMRKRVRPAGPFYRLDLDYFLRNNIYTRIQIVHGYGESLIDYNRKVSKIGVGFVFSAHEARGTRHRIQ